MTERFNTEADALRLQLYGWFGPRTLDDLRSLVGDDADDVQQEVWLTVFGHIPRWWWRWRG